LNNKETETSAKVPQGGGTGFQPVQFLLEKPPARPASCLSHGLWQRSQKYIVSKEAGLGG
jgi:hypothetical protein